MVFFYLFSANMSDFFVRMAWRNSIDSYQSEILPCRLIKHRSEQRFISKETHEQNSADILSHIDQLGQGHIWIHKYLTMHHAFPEDNLFCPTYTHAHDSSSSCIYNFFQIWISRDRKILAAFFRHKIFHFFLWISNKSKAYIHSAWDGLIHATMEIGKGFQRAFDNVRQRSRSWALAQLVKTSKNHAIVLGAVHKWRNLFRGRGYAKRWRTLSEVMTKSQNKGEGGGQALLVRKKWRHIWTGPYTTQSPYDHFISWKWLR